MSFPFEWNPSADQPHNVAPKSGRRRHHVKHAGSYLEIAARNLGRAVPILRRYARTWRTMYAAPVAFRSPFACAVSEAGPRNVETVALLKQSGAGATLVRVPSWERDDLGRHERFVRLLREAGFEVTVALLQRREDVLDPAAWRSFLEEICARFAGLASALEVGHAWNRTKWGVWDHREYVRLAEPAFEIVPRHGLRLIGPAVIDFEFHLYPVTLPKLPFETVTSLLYVDRMGAPENAQFGWTTPRKLALLRAVVDACRPGSPRTPLWITEFNWPLAGTGPWSPAAGRPNVSEEEQADFLVRYGVLVLASGLAEKVFWWQLVAPGYGLVDSREAPWRKRPAFAAFRTLVSRLDGATFEGARGDARKDKVRSFLFRRGGESFAVAWAVGGSAELDFDRPVRRVIGRDGGEEPGRAGARRITIDGSPRYVVFDE
jgi:hypothetical protein